MKLSQMSSSQAADTLIRISEPVYSIMGDDKLSDTLKGFAEIYENEKSTIVKIAGYFVAKVLPAILETHKTDCDEILSVFTGKTVEELAKENILVYINDAREILDKDLIDFFRKLRS